MKRTRTEQLQTTTLLYLKRRNYAESEVTFRQTFRFESSSEQTASACLLNNKVSCIDAIAMTSQNLSDYFNAFNAFLKFIHNTTVSNKNQALGNLLYPVFLHAYLDLAIAGRLTEAEEFFTLFYDDDRLQKHEDVLSLVRQVREPDDLKKHFNVANIRKKYCSVSLASEEKELLMRFLHSQDSLLVMKIIKERICLTDTTVDAFESKNVCKDIAFGKNLLPHEKKLPERRVTVKNKTLSSNVAEEKRMIISPPSLLPTPCVTSKVVSPEKSIFPIISVDETSVRRCIDKIRESTSIVENVCLFQYEDALDSIIHATISNSKRTICCGDENGSVVLWNVCQPIMKDEPGCSEKTSVLSDTAETEPDAFKCSKVYPIISHVTFGNQSKEAVLENARKTSSWRLNHLLGERVVRLQGHSGSVFSSVFTDDDQHILTCSEDTTVRLWDLDNMCNKVVYKGHNFPVWCIAMSAFSLYFATGSMDRTARLWSLERTFPLRIYAGHEQSVDTVSFHRNASYLASADHTVRLWDVNCGKTVRLMLGHWAPVTALAFSPDGKLLASSGEDCRIRIWDIASGNLLKEIRSHSDTVYSVDFSPDSSMLASCGLDSSLYVWNVSNSSPASNLHDSTASGSKHPHLIAHWKLNDYAKKLLLCSFSGDALNCVATL